MEPWERYFDDDQRLRFQILMRDDTIALDDESRELLYELCRVWIRRRCSA